MFRVEVDTKAEVKIKVRKTGKTYHRTEKFARRVIEGHLDGEKTTTYYLREGRGWKEVSEAEYKEATSKESVRVLHEQLGLELEKRVERIMQEEAAQG